MRIRLDGGRRPGDGGGGEGRRLAGPDGGQFSPVAGRAPEAGEANAADTVRAIAETASRIEEPLRTLAAYLEKGNFAEYIYLVTRPSRLIWINLLGGLSRGVGIGVGFTVIAALLVYVLQALAVYNLPVIGGFIADLVKIVQSQLHTPRVP